MSNKSLETISRLTHYITAINGQSGPALTQYGQERVELGGPIVSRWLVKVANYLTNEPAVDLFGTGEATPTRIYIYTTLQPWQDILWQIAARTMGWKVLDTRRPLPGDFFVANILDSKASGMLDAGAHVLTRPAQYLSFAWDSPLDRTLDGLAGITIQLNALVVGTPPLPIQARGEALVGTYPSTSVQGCRVALLWDAHTGTGQVLDQWMQGRSVLIINPNTIPPNRLTQILATEDADGGFVAYQRQEATTRRGLARWRA